MKADVVASTETTSIQSFPKADSDVSATNATTPTDILGVIFDFSGLGTEVSGKYEGEVAKLASILTNDVAIVHSFSEVQTKVPCISIQLSSDIEDRTLTMLEDFGGFDDDDRDIGTTYSNVQIMLGVHTKEALTTKYLYTVVKIHIII